MRFNKLDLNLLVALDAMLHTCNITRAAEQLHMSQSAMSNCLARLREYFRDDLLTPVGRTMERTPRGEILKDAVHDLLLRIDTTLSSEPTFDPASSDRVFTIAASDYTCLVLMPELLTLAEKQKATVRFNIVPQVGDTAKALERGEADVMIIPKKYCSPSHPSEILFEETFSCLFWTQSQWAGKGIDLEAYKTAGHVTMQPTGTDRPAFGSKYLEDQGIDRRIEISTYSFMSEPALVIGTERIATVLSRLAEWATAHMPVKSSPLPIEIPVMQQAIQWHKYRSTDPGLVWLLELFRQATERMR